jgi:hypothetical protein
MVAGLSCCQTKNLRRFWNWNQPLAIVANRLKKSRDFAGRRDENTCAFDLALDKSGNRERLHAALDCVDEFFHRPHARAVHSARRL